ncbi:MAG TPA: heme ABC transporter ATP-binding protein [Chitinophagaceae bacterium]|nr:heme ABC transporter ATP-binding protein [Chitinophagaceae bacterium]
MLKTEGISYSIGNKQILNDINISFQPGEFTMILGPNGSGKSSFLKIFSGEIHQYRGAVYYNGIAITNFRKEELARRRSVLSQHADLGFPLSVAEVIMMGRYPHFTFSPNKKDISICEDVIEQMDLLDFRERNYLTLSGGEKQRVQFARILAQIWEKPAEGDRYLFLDEPLNSLDLNYQQSFLKIATAFSKAGTVLVAIMHDINLALKYATRILFMKEGSVVYETDPTRVTGAMIKNIFNVDATIIQPANDLPPVVIYQ